MSKSVLLVGLLTTVVNLLLHALAYVVILRDVFRANPPVSLEFQQQLERPPDQLIVWAMIATALAHGFLITTIMKWSGARTFASGMKYGAVSGWLFWSAVNFGLYASSNHFSQVSMFYDLVSSATIMTISSAFAAWSFGRSK